MTRIAALTVLAGALAMTACEQANDPATRRGNVQRNQSNTNNANTMPNNPVGRDTTAPAPAAGANVMHQQMLTTWKSQISGVQGQVEQLQTRITSYQGTDKQQVQQEYQDLQQKVNQLNQRVQSFNVSDSGGFDQFRGDIETQMTQINDQLRSLNQKLDQAPQQDPTLPPSDPNSPQQPPAEGPDTPTMPDTTDPQNPNNPR